jgi:hypothetical protein
MITREISKIEKALKRLRHIARQHRYGGMMEDYELAQDALSALERVRQPLFGDADVDAG